MAREDDIVTALNGMSADLAPEYLAKLPVSLLRKVADLQGIDSVDMTKYNAIQSIMAETYAPCETAGTWSDTQTNAGLAGTVPPEFAGF